MRAVWRPKPSSCADAVTNVIVSPGYSLDEKSSPSGADDPVEVDCSLQGTGGGSPLPPADAPRPVRAPFFDSPCGDQFVSLSVPTNCSLELPSVDFHISRTLVSCPVSVVDTNYPFSNSNGPNAPPVEVPDFIAVDNKVVENHPDNVNSQSSEEWTAEVIANDPMHYALLRCLLGENDSQSFFNSITKDQRVDHVHLSPLLVLSPVALANHSLTRCIGWSFYRWPRCSCNNAVPFLSVPPCKSTILGVLFISCGCNRKHPWILGCKICTGGPIDVAEADADAASCCCWLFGVFFISFDAAADADRAMADYWLDTQRWNLNVFHHAVPVFPWC
ncbi:hypothetical protein Nepgr_014744 [Nepenthes gracilis]|uniref:Uncharacterized protein n=1 Tax=Nepenthes gracilis TaxID=150966 RepID=A0AAD3SK19_NEPGR|nr:hypothetical protein Nepgr_014744 [Nepenthes gracilis]